MLNWRIACVSFSSWTLAQKREPQVNISVWRTFKGKKKLGSGEAETYRIQESTHDVLEVGRKERGAVIVFEPRSKLGHGVADLLSDVGHVPDGSQQHSYYLGEGLLVDDCQCVYKLEYATCSNNIVTQLRGAGS